ncbi:SH3 domain-containing protein [Roseovarius dicentrarchi]|uniref:SH3 domain-containing protein n=1 Tax=Roseovarius dicentrarchi TaxID=2250573 RepID=UPI000DE88009|nr:SH3 domain-containing protein [Roseovarius dicentrarchi]
MRKIITGALAAVALGAVSACGATMGGTSGLYKVAGVEEGDMLKLRAGPGTGFSVIAGLPNDSVVRVYSCERTGSTRWCKASMQQPGGLDGYVSWAYLQRL